MERYVKLYCWAVFFGFLSYGFMNEPIPNGANWTGVILCFILMLVFAAWAYDVEKRK